MRIIEAFEKVNIIYIHSTKIDLKLKKITINFLENPQNQKKIVKRLIFCNFKTFVDHIDEDDYDEDCLDSLIDIQETNINQFKKYIVRTEQREIEICTEYVPLLEDLY